MSKWNIGNAYEDIFGDHYSAYLSDMEEIEQLNQLRQRVHNEFMIDNPGTLGSELLGIRQSYQKLIDNLDTKNYGWNGKDMRACWQRSLELRDEIRQAKQLMREAGESILAGIDARRSKLCSAALRNVESFSVCDKITGGVDTTAKQIREQLAAMLRTL